MRKTKWILLTIALIMLSIVVGQAGTGNLTFKDPITWDDGSVLTTIIGHNFYYGAVKGGPYPNKFPVGTGTNFSINTFPTGTNYVVVTALATNLTGSVIEGIQSNEAVKIIDDRRPGACTNLN